MTIPLSARPFNLLLSLKSSCYSFVQDTWNKYMASFWEGSSGEDQEDAREEKTREKDQFQGHHKSQAQHPGYTGLINQGATCYLNSILQCLFFTQELQDAVRRCEDQGESSLVTQLRRLFEALEETQGPVSTTTITRCLELRDVHRQEDALLCFHMLLTRMTAEQRELGQFFQMTLEQVIQCQRCENKTQLEEARLFLVVPVLQGTPGTPCSLDKAVEGLFQKEWFIGDNQYFCDECDRKEDACSDENSYDLFAVCHHLGDVTGGHYLADIKPSKDHRWYRFSDHTVEVSAHCAFAQDLGPHTGRACLSYSGSNAGTGRPAQISLLGHAPARARGAVWCRTVPGFNPSSALSWLCGVGQAQQTEFLLEGG
ncbi:ubiquitin carboxyl-terminal hydrolase 7-like isoform X1 [Echinops telfairi]|uniref:Ubiquitin carboxyl-terminal hydrolase 7-like isoform X1 n=1 Tax=Echinops telfairi TaxID=9371 RepID=A0AC55DK04_ECHTE|nr:ubiquitin carboxyl-terminal hydrolase 7-like isoform X1 [Echinops telfairi]